MGGKKGGGSSHTPVEAKETGRSFQIARMLEVISEGEIHGLVDDMCSVYLDKTPLQNKDGSFNFKNVSVYANSGTQNQDPLREFTSVEKEIDVNTKILKDKPIIKTVTDVNVNRIRMTLGVERLLRQEDNGDTNPTVVAMQIDVLKNNAVVESRTYEFNGKYSNAYREMFDLTVPKPPFSIRVTRIQDDSTTNKLQNGCFWSSYTEIIDKEFAYPNTALVGIKIDSEYFSNIPTRNYEIYGLMVKVPSNYDAFNHRYTSDFWDGSFKLSWTNNPAWIFYDLVTNTRYGMGQRLGEFGIDKWQLYAIGRYCDELVPDGFGGTEPRMTCNIWITDQRKAYELINDITSIFRAMPVWNGQALTAIQDRASDPVWTYNNANTIGGFTRQRSAKKARHNVIQVEYIDASDFYEKKVESVSDDALVARYGQNVKKVTAFGCTSRGQAYRTGRWILETEKLETETITFTVGQEGVMHLPYDVIEVADSQYAGMDIGGRVLAVNGTQVTLDRTIEVDSESYLSYVSQRGITENVKIVSFDKNTNIATVAKSLNGLPELTVWGLSTKRISTGLYRAISIKENDNADGKTYTITALQHVPEKEDIVVNGTHFDPKPKSIYGDVVDAEITYNGSKLTVSGKINGSYNVLSSSQVVSYTVKLLKDGALVYIEKGLKSPDIKVDDLENGSYTAEISSYNAKNQLLQTYTKTFVINRPPLVTGIDIVGHLSSVILTWNFVDDTTQTEIWSSERDDINSAELVERITGMYYSHEIGAKKVRYYWLRHKRGVNVGNFDQIQGRKGESGTDLDAELKLLNEKLSENIVNQIIDVALPARKLGMLKSVDNLDVNVYAGADNVVNGADNTIYVWDGRKYIPSKQRLLAEAIEGVLQPHQLAQIPSTQIKGTLTSEQIQSLDATKLIGTINVARIPSIPTNKLTGVLTDAQVQSLSATKLIGSVPIAQVPNIPTTKLTGSVTDAQIATLNASKLTGTVAVDRLPTVPTSKLSGNITNAQIEAVSASKIDGKLNLANIPSIPTTQLTGTVGANLIQANAIGTNHLGANVITSEKINAGAVNARAIATDAIQAQHVSANAIGANHITANAIKSNHLFVGDYQNLIVNGSQEDGTLRGWAERFTFDTTDKPQGTTGSVVFEDKSYTPTFESNIIDVVYEEQYLLEYWLKADKPNSRIYAQIIDIATGTHSIDGTPAYPIDNVIVPTEWTYFSRVLRFKPNTRQVKFQRLWINHQNGSERTAIVKMAGVRLRPMNKGNLIVDGAVSANKIQADAVSAEKIQAGAITAQKIATNAVTADKILANAITSDKIQANAITAVKIATNAVTADKVLANAITADKIATNAVTAVKIQANAITSDKINANAVTAQKIATDAIEANKIKAGAIIAGKLATDAVLAHNIKAGAINADKLEAGSVGTRVLQALAITAEKIQANAITAEKIRANAINSEHISAGQISADKLAIGLGGNLLQNPIFSNPTNGLPFAWRKATYANVTERSISASNSDSWVDTQVFLTNENLVRYSLNTTNSNVPVNGQAGWFGQTGVSVIPNQTYIFSAYVSGHRLNARLYIDCRSADGGYHGHQVSELASGSMRGNIGNAKRLFVKFKVPSNANSVDLYIMGYKADSAGSDNALMLVARPMLEECTEHATAPSAWVNAGVTSIHGGSIVTNTVTAQQIMAGTITANEIAGNTITANKIAGRTITADKIVAGTLTNNEIRTKTITADRLVINELSALTSNIGTITAGTITGTTINGNTITGGTINGTEITGGIIRGAKFIGATGDFTGTLQVSSTLGAEVGSYTQKTAFKLISSTQTSYQSCYDDSNNSRNTVCTGENIWSEHWQSEITFNIPSNPEETIILPPNKGFVKSYNPTANGLLGSDGKVLRSGTTYTIVVTVNEYKSVTRWQRNKTPANYDVTMKRHKRF